jgi:predicted GIY-YIG superfamily endonuclease
MTSKRRVGEHEAAQARLFYGRYKVKLVYFEEFSDINRAIGREKEIKSITGDRGSS